MRPGHARYTPIRRLCRCTYLCIHWRAFLSGPSDMSSAGATADLRHFKVLPAPNDGPAGNNLTGCAGPSENVVFSHWFDYFRVLDVSGIRPSASYPNLTLVFTPILPLASHRPAHVPRRVQSPPHSPSCVHALPARLPCTLSLCLPACLRLPPSGLSLPYPKIGWSNNPSITRMPAHCSLALPRICSGGSTNPKSPVSLSSMRYAYLAPPTSYA